MRHIQHCFEHTLSLPSMRRPRFSYSHTETVARDCRSLKMKLIGGRRTMVSSASWFSIQRASCRSYLFLRRDLGCVSSA